VDSGVRLSGIGQTAIDLVLLGAIPIVALAFSAAVVLDALVEVHGSGTAMISVENLTKQYGATTVVDGVSMVIERKLDHGDRGHLRSGKSTLLRMINRLVEPTRGRVLIDGNDTTGEPAHLLRRRIGYVIQDTACSRTAPWRRTSRPCRDFLGWDAARLRARVEELLCVFPARSAGLRRSNSRISSRVVSSSASVWARALALSPPYC